uniref:GPI alpha-1,4-mannosyltransferase I, catalytic subunit n=1 Tax=Strigamia maritima TaxID=126957 RepID=T1J704_STRMM
MDSNQKTETKTPTRPEIDARSIKTNNSLTKWLKYQLVSAALVRICLVFYGTWHDVNFALKYTDVDYHVFSDAALLVTDGKSPYSRPTYRYSPLLAWILTLNIYIDPIWGKLFFVTCDIITGHLIYCVHNIYGTSRRWTRISTFVWLFNPLTLAISTRGSADSLMTCLVLSTLCLLLTKRYLSSGLMFGLAVHVRIYPLIYCLPFYFSLQMPRESKWTFWNLFYPNPRRIKFTIATLVSLASLTFLGYFCYGDSFINEAYLYHIFRKDVRHNFSPYFYMLYLTSGSDVPFLNMLTFVPQFVLLLTIGFKFYEEKYLPLCLFAQTFVFVSLNKVCTSQYFLWYVGLIPFIIPRLKMSHRQIFSCVMIWLSTQSIWLFFAYLLEFRGLNTFFCLWLSSLAFYLGNMFVLAEIIKNFDVKNCKQM